MAKSIRAKAKMANRRKQRERGNYAAADAARVARLSARLLGKTKGKGKEGEEVKDDDEEVVGGEDGAAQDTEMDEANPKKISTAGPRDNRRESWRSSKGMVARPKKGALNSQGQAGGRHKAGRPKRRR
ncbi:hypothetical protein BCR39DRAFT_530367 [Naematelia encephala]|uniref:DUF2423 domain-containing protein n=1 Tax=Naematelia encephala TaxID=71784 RepID=A0A1Y2B566_9TREE|nr:hypothetical protein BCR39DRAFT_530367 [Naematelia encephala]